jgi:hypothetical protein
VATRGAIRAFTDGTRPDARDHRGMHPQDHRPLCTIEMIATGHAERCPGEACAFWDHGCVLTRVESELDGRPEVARLLLDLRRQVEDGRGVEVDDARSSLSRILNEEEGIDEPL